MINRLSITLFLFAFGLQELEAQDFHFSQFDKSYLNLNPALTGSFNGTYRINGNYRNQWSSISEPFTTFAFSGEIRNPFSKIKNLHLGINFLNDQAGVGNLQSNFFYANVAYSYKIIQYSSLNIKIGTQFGLNSRSIDFNQFSFDQQYQNGLFNPNSSSGETFNSDSYNHFNVGMGVSFEYIENQNSYEIGFSYFNLNGANQSFLSSSIPLDKKLNLFLKGDISISDKVYILPSIYYAKQGEFQETIFGSNVRYRLKQNEYYKRNFYLGLWYRNKDALIAAVGMDYNQWNVGLSYDINTSSLERASNNRGGIELSVTYIISRFRTIFKNYPRCPKFL